MGATKSEDRAMTGVERIAEERKRQIEKEGWSAEHDDKHSYGQMAEAAGQYINHELSILYGPNCVTFEDYRKNTPPSDWPWHKSYWKPSSDPIRDLVKAGALIAAEIDRLVRLEGNK